ncbi:MAG: T9SS type A sorting domain-containing protein [Ignavibacteriaceae bacterium]|nr:T9SS type A sorting domain-containing protein [Ignavibacteriaceae bacterium]
MTLNPNDDINFKVNPPSTANLTVTNASVSIVKVEDVSDYNSYSEMGFYNSTSSLSIGTSFTDLTNSGYTSSNFQNWSHLAGVLTAGSGSAGTYLVCASFNFNGSANTGYTLSVSKNDSDPVEIKGERKISNNNDIGNVTLWGVLAISEGDNLKIKAKADGNNKDLDVKYCQISLVKINGGSQVSEPFPYASMDISTSSPTPISLTASTDNQITGYSNDVTDINYWSFNSSKFSPIGISAGYYRINYFVSYSTSAGADITFKILNNGIEIDQLTGRRTTSGTDRGALGGNGIILISNPTDQLYMTANPTSGVDISVYQSRLSLSRIEKTSDVPLPVELSSFSVVVLENGVKLEWRTETEVNNYGFEILRSTQNDSWQKLGFVEGHGNSNSPKDYSFVDNNVTAGKYSYRLKQLDTDGSFEYSKAIEVDLGSPGKFELSQNYPNPFNPVTTIKYSIPEAGNVKLVVYNLLGEQVAELVNEFKEAGVHTINFNAENLQSGLFIYKIEAIGVVQSKKMTLIK